MKSTVSNIEERPDNKPELLAPAGDMKRLEVALEYGADAVYLSGKKLGMRAACKNFDYDGLKTASLAAHCNKKKFYVTLNIFPNDSDLSETDGYVDYLNSIHADGVIVSDLGLIKRIAKLYPQIPIHVSTQANVMNTETAKVYADLGAKRIVLARELSLSQIRKIRDGLDDSVKLEAFVHGAMCISYSGRCLISAYLTGRSANRGECNQACRMYFKPENDACGEALEFVQDDGTYIFGGNDLNMIEHLGDLIDAGVNAFKIEGRVKSEYYVGCITGAYRRALDLISAGKPVPQEVAGETAKAPNRGFNTGFYYGQPKRVPTDPKYYEFCGIVIKDTKEGAIVEMRNRFRTGETLEILSSDDAYQNKSIVVPTMCDEKGAEIIDAKVPAMRVLLKGVKLPVLSMLRRAPTDK